MGARLDTQGVHPWAGLPKDTGNDRCVWPGIPQPVCRPSRVTCTPQGPPRCSSTGSPCREVPKMEKLGGVQARMVCMPSSVGLAVLALQALGVLVKQVVQVWGGQALGVQSAHPAASGSHPIVDSPLIIVVWLQSIKGCECEAGARDGTLAGVICGYVLVLAPRLRRSAQGPMHTIASFAAGEPCTKQNAQHAQHDRA